MSVYVQTFFLSLSICLCVGVCSLSSVNAVQNTEENNSKTEYKLGEKGGYLTSNYSSTKILMKSDDLAGEKVEKVLLQKRRIIFLISCMVKMLK